MPGVVEYLVLGAVLFALGLVGFLSRRNLIVMFLCTELMFQGVVITAVAYARLHAHLDGQAFGLFLLVIAAVEAALAMALVMALQKYQRTLDATAFSEMSG